VLKILGSYIQDHSPVPTAPATSNGFGPGYGSPSPRSTTIDLYYAARQVQELLAAKDSVRNLHIASTLGVDMSNAELWGVDWNNIRFDWLSSAFLPKIDLRSSDLVNAKFEDADLAGSYLQCADLRNAHMEGADLRGADLRGADVDGGLSETLHCEFFADLHLIVIRVLVSARRA
jgi:hypothetical protein